MSLELTKKIVKTLDDKLARDIEVIKTEEVTIVAEMMGKYSNIILLDGEDKIMFLRKEAV